MSRSSKKQRKRARAWMAPLHGAPRAIETVKLIRALYSPMGGHAMGFAIDETGTVFRNSWGMWNGGSESLARPHPAPMSPEQARLWRVMGLHVLEDEDEKSATRADLLGRFAAQDIERSK